MERDPIFLVIDLFCGFGGTTAGFHEACWMDHRIAEVIACVNHDPKAIRSHWLNNPRVKHYNEDIRTLDLTDLKALVAQYRIRYPNARLILWASLECTNFSRAKGGRPRNADSRTLANHLVRYVMSLDPDLIMIENVTEFMAWGPLIPKVVKKGGIESCPVKLVKDKNGRMHVECQLIPESSKKGQYWIKWRRKMCRLGYRDDWKQLNSANFGAYTARNRLFGIFAKPCEAIAWPEPTHAKRPEGKKKALSIQQASLFPEYDNQQALKKWLPVREVLNFSDEGESIFHREKPLAEKSLERIYAGLLKFVAEGNTSFLSKYYSGDYASKNISLTGPASTITPIDHHSFISTDSLSEITRRSSMILPTAKRTAIAQFLMHYYTSGGVVSSILAPCPTVRTRDGSSIIKTTHFLEKQYSKSIGQSVDYPTGALLPTDKNRLLTAVPLANGQKKSKKKKPETGANWTTSGNGLLHFLVNPSWGGNPGSVEEPCCVIVARQDKAPLYFVQAERGNLSIAIYETDSPATVKIKNFMAAYGLVDIKMRMLRVEELLRIQGFPDTYQMVGNQTDRKKFIGNSVVPHVVKAWCEALAAKTTTTRLATAA
ncbi:DNA cytosine methyltransferase [Puia dinghuensis]|uniref:DNA (cytosine-5-)-methyltransferase n=1 Tax=Puia dinghuensis TaxID=1792502 RepID=A0A8J2XS72_9BACT|nr:DNA cytosine methyltransferase [Puia dinghuensis]GGA92637.1 hypothetical protein GCM10011511_15030 [Puia dinghuensis]